MKNDKNTFVLLHGAWYGKWCWDEVAGFLRNQGHQVIYFDLPNYVHGESTEEITLHTYVECLHDQVKHLKKPPVLVGHSMSGVVLSQFAELYPKKVDRLIYVSAFMLRNGESIWGFISRRKSDEVGAVKQSVQLPSLNGYSFPVLKIDRSTERFCADVSTIDIGRFSLYSPATSITTLLQTKQINIGIIRGAGVGNKLADFFIKFLELVIAAENSKRLADNKPSLKVRFLEDLDSHGNPYVYDSFKTLTETSKDFKKKSQKDAKRLEDTVKNWFIEHDIKTIFRTSINAEALYLFRQKVKAIKEIALETPIGGHMLIIRDQTEGFYANTTYGSGEEEIHFSGIFTKENQQALVNYALNKAEQFFNKEPFTCAAIYKFHLFGNVLENWHNQSNNNFDILSLQPDSGLTELIQFVSKGYFNQKKIKNLLVICSNEVGDLVLETVFSSINLISPKNELYSRNVYTAPPFNGQLMEYQTVHGSADDLIDSKGNVDESLNPIATFRIAAVIAENILGIQGARQKMEESIIFSKRFQMRTTTEITSFIFSHFINTSLSIEI